MLKKLQDTYGALVYNQQQLEEVERWCQDHQEVVFVQSAIEAIKIARLSLGRINGVG